MSKTIVQTGIWLILMNLSAFAQQSPVSLNSGSVAHRTTKAAQEVAAAKEDVHDVNDNNSNRVKAEVPGTVFGVLVAAGLEKDPNFGDNIYQVDKKKYDRNFWYRTTYIFG